jgi:M-phase inducer tyrosine phosphatase
MAFKNPDEDFQRIPSDRLCELLNNPSPFKKVVVVDCRGRDEYEGGHIRGAINATSEQDHEKIFREYYSSDTCFVFHCEFSQIRGPGGLHDFQDVCMSNRAVLPRMYVLDRGYRGFYREHQDYCVSGYLPEHNDAE